MDVAPQAVAGTAGEPSHAHGSNGKSGHAQSFLALTALGVVFGDIGTSPLYAFSSRARRHRPCTVPPRRRARHRLAHLLGADADHLAQIRRPSSCAPTMTGRAASWRCCLWSSVATRPRSGAKLSIVDPARRHRRGASLWRRRHHAGDLGFVRRSKVSNSVPRSANFVVPVTLVILVGPVRAAIPRHRQRRPAVRSGDGGLVRRHRRAGHRQYLGRRRRSSERSIRSTRCASRLASPFTLFLVLGGVFLALTGGEALYADMGHVGRPAIRLAWFGLVLPGADP